MKRKLVQQGSATLMISLPSKWIKSNKLLKGDELNVIEKGDFLQLCTEEKKSAKSVSIDLAQLDPIHKRAIAGCYMNGVDEIRVTYKDPKILRKIQDEILYDLIGFDIVSQSRNACTIKAISTLNPGDFDQLLRRTFLLLKSMFEEIITCAKSKETKLEHVIYTDRNVNKFTSYCLRTLNKSGYHTPEHTHVVYSIINGLEEMGDRIKAFARYITNNNILLKKDHIEYLERVHKLFDTYYKLFYNPKPDQAVIISKEFNQLKEEIVKANSQTNDHSELNLLDHIHDLGRKSLKLMGHQLTILF